MSTALTVRALPEGYKKIRLGNLGDGGYVVVVGGPHSASLGSYDAIVSAGVYNDSSFEEDIVTRITRSGQTCPPTRLYDGTIPEDWRSTHETRLRIKAGEDVKVILKNIEPVETETTTNLHALLETHRDIFLKMDIEGAEYPWFDTLSEAQLKHIKQIVMEVHWLSDDDARALRTMERLSDTHWLVHIHGNNNAGVRSLSPGVSKLPQQIVVPHVIEFTYVRKDFFGSQTSDLPISQEPLPGPLDGINNPYKGADIPLIGYPYNCF